jgi:hypothetical protein
VEKKSEGFVLDTPKMDRSFYVVNFHHSPPHLYSGNKENNELHDANLHHERIFTPCILKQNDLEQHMDSPSRMLNLNSPGVFMRTGLDLIRPIPVSKRLFFNPN